MCSGFRSRLPRFSLPTCPFALTVQVSYCHVKPGRPPAVPRDAGAELHALQAAWRLAAASPANSPGRAVAYHALDTGNDMVMTISLFQDRGQAEASNELAAQWVAEELSDFNVTRVGVIGGEAMVSRASAEILELAQPEAPYGLNGVGEPPTIASTAAVLAALRDATGNPLTRVPVRPDDLIVSP